MENQSNSHGGAFLRAPSQKKHFTQLFFFGGAFIVVAVIVLVMSLKGSAADRVVYYLPDEVPRFSLPENLEDNSGSLVLEELIVPYFDFTIEAGSNSIDVSLPIITAGFGAEFNASVLDQLDTLISNIMFYLDEDICIVKNMTYEAFLDQEILTVLLYTEYTDGQSRCQPWCYDLTNGYVLIDDTCELTERLIGMDYASFLWVTDRYIQDQFAHTYFDDAYSVPEAEVSNKQREFLDAYKGIVRKIPRDISNAFSRWIFPADGKVFLVFQLPIISNDWYVGFLSETVVVEIDKSILKYKDMVTPKEAVLETVLDSTVHVMGATDQSHALLTRTVFYSSPDVFISAAACVPETDQEYMIESLIRYADETDYTKMLTICENLKAGENLTNSESDVIAWIISKINDER